MQNDHISLNISVQVALRPFKGAYENTSRQHLNKSLSDSSHHHWINQIHHLGLDLAKEKKKR